MATKITITEALAEVKTITKRIEKKRANIIPYLARDTRLTDPHDEDGGSRTFIERERQAIGDLNERLIAIRTAIQESNLKTSLTVEGKTRSVFEWLIWRKEVAQGEKSELSSMFQFVQNARNQGMQRGYSTTTSPSRVTVRPQNAGDNLLPDPPKEIVVNVNEKELAESIEAAERVLGALDGKLSLVNATTSIEVRE